MTRLRALPTVAAGILAVVAVAAPIAAQDEVGMFGNTPSRNMVSDETGVPETWDPRTGANILWSQPVGSQAYGGPTVANGKVYVGTNNEGVRDPAYEGDMGVLMAFDAASGDFIWQMVHDKLSAGRVNDWPLQGVCSTAFIEGDRVWYVSNQAHVVCLDLPSAGDRLAAVANRIGGTTLQLDVTAPDAGERLVEHLTERFGGVADWISFDFAPGTDLDQQREILSKIKAIPGVSWPAA